MIVLARAPFLVVLTGLVAMLALSDRVVPWALPLVALLAASGVMTSSFRLELKGQWRIAACVLALVFLFSLWIVFALNRRPFIPPFVETAGTVVESRPWGRFTAVAVRTPQGGFVLSLPFATLTEGERIKVQGVPRPFRSDSSGGSDFREDRFWRARGMTARLASAKTEPLPERGFRGWNPHRWRYALYRSLVIRLPRLTAAYLNAAWTGKRDSGLNASHRSWGTSHLLAVSGFHVGIVMMGASVLFKRGRGRVYGLSLFLWLYILLTGAPASATRAGLMIQIALLGELAGRPGSAINSASLAAVLLLARSPFWFWDVGWRLSVLAALVIAAVLERGSPNDWRIWLGVSPMIWLATFPQASWTFESVPLVGVLLNLVAPPFFGFALAFASVLALFYFLGIPGTIFFSNVCLYALEGAFMLWGTLADAAARGIPWQLGWNPFFAYCCAGGFIALLCRALFVPWRSVAVLTPLGALAAFVLFGA
ncbi:MAG: ComEC/Rec2 family competence protein [Synergistaceae bacterium]|jgi:competence protein ComEC|nr:ComEC/Rec2 family competence protein [Synergistaceae bacterium]